MNPMGLADVMKLTKMRRTSNNYRKLHGGKTVRYKHLQKARYKRLKNWQMDVASFYPIFSMLGEVANRAACSFAEFTKALMEMEEKSDG